MHSLQARHGRVEHATIRTSRGTRGQDGDFHLCVICIVTYKHFLDIKGVKTAVYARDLAMLR